MIPLYTNDEFISAKEKDKLPCQCETCKKTFYKTKNDIRKCLDVTKRDTGDYCSNKCFRVNSQKIEVVCLNCNKQFYKRQCEIRKTPNNFCSKSCAGTYNNKHKTSGNRRSKLETYLENELKIQFPNLKIDYNKKDAIGSELDIYIPSLKLAFELNGIFHYEPIFGLNKLNQIKENDISKSKACIDNQIDLCIIDTSTLKYFKPINAKIFSDIIIEIINQRILIE